MAPFIANLPIMLFFQHHRFWPVPTQPRVAVFKGLVLLHILDSFISERGSVLKSTTPNMT